MNIKTITTTDGVNTVDFGSAASRFYWVENLGSTTVYVSGEENIVPDGDNVKVLSADCSTMIESFGGKVYILGAGKFQITNQGDKFPPFRNAPAQSGGGGVELRYRIRESATDVSWEILENGSSMGNADFNIVGYEVSAGDVINVRAKNSAKCKFVFQNQFNVTSIVPNTAIIGSPYTDDFDGTIAVPEGASWICFSVPKDDVETGVYRIIGIAEEQQYIPTSLPANGGNADTVDGYHVDSGIHSSSSIPPEYITDFLRISDDNKSIERWNTDVLKVAFAKNATNADTVGGKSAGEFMPYIGYVTDLGAVNRNCICSWNVNTLNTPFRAGKTNSSAGMCIVNNIDGMWPTYFSICAGAKQCFIHYKNQNNGEFIGNWKEISTTPIKSTTFSSTSDGTGNFNLWAPSENKVPISIQLDNKSFYAVPFLYNNQLWLGSTINEVTRQPVTDTTVSGTVYYIEV